MINFIFPLVMQLLVIVSSDWSDINGTMYCYERSSNFSEWHLHYGPIPVALGKKEMEWEPGLHSLEDSLDLQKQKGNDKSPTEIFSLAPIFEVYSNHTPFVLITDNFESIDDSNSIYSNQPDHSNSVEKKDLNSSEKMKEIGFLYDLGLVIQHNCHQIKENMRPAIFLHMWRNKGMGTGGYTAMEEKNLNEVISWLDKDQNPCLVKLPINEYMNLQATWSLPELPPCQNIVSIEKISE